MKDWQWNFLARNIPVAKAPAAQAENHCYEGVFFTVLSNVLPFEIMNWNAITTLASIFPHKIERALLSQWSYEED